MTHRPAYSMSIRPRLLLTSLACLLTFAAHAQVITTFAGTDFVFAPENSQALRAPLGQVNSVTIDATGNLYVTDEGNNMVLRISASGLITVLAGNGLRGFSGDGGAAANASLNIPWGVAVDVAGNVYFADSNNHRIREVTADGRILTVAGTGAVGFSGDGGPANRAQ